MKLLKQWVMPKGDWTDADKNAYSKHIKWMMNQVISLACGRFDAWYATITEADMEHYERTVVFVISEYIEYRKCVPRKLPTSINIMAEEAVTNKHWFGINGQSVCEFNRLGDLGDMSMAGMQRAVIERYKRKLLTKVYRSKTEQEWVDIALKDLKEGDY